MTEFLVSGTDAAGRVKIRVAQIGRQLGDRVVKSGQDELAMRVPDRNRRGRRRRFMPSAA